MSDELAAIADLLTDSGFHGGLIAGLVGAVLFGVVGLIRGKPTPGWALTLAAALAIGLAIATEIEARWWFALLVLIGSGALVDLVYRWTGGNVSSVHLSWLLGAAGAVLAGSLITTSTTRWVTAGLAVSVFALALGLWSGARSALAGLIGPMVAIAVAGIWVTVPETDIVVVFVGAVIPLGLLTLSPVSGRIAASGALAVAGLLCWVAMVGGVARPWTIVASWAVALGIPVVLYLGSLRRLRRLVAFAIYLAYAVVVTRIADVVDTDGPMLVASIALLVAAGLAAWYLGAPAIEQEPEPARI